MTKRILVIEDDRIGRKVVVDFLSARGFEVWSAKNGTEGLEEAKRVKPDLVVCDVMLPQKNGFEVCFELKRAAETRDVPVILMSAICKDAHDEKHAAALHAQGYFVKPFPLKSMLDRIRELFA